MTVGHKIEISPHGTFRHPAGPYDPRTRLPRYEVDVMSVDAHTRLRVVIDHEIMGTIDNFTWVWKITNNSTWSVFITLTKDGAPV